MIKYTEATQRPYGYLFIDLKQNTPEEDRLKTDIFDIVADNKRCSPNMVGGSVEENINRDTREVSQFEDKPQSEQTYSRDFEKDHKNIEEKMPSCDDCGLIFENISDLARHMNRWCPENNDLKRKREDIEA
jgi:CRISPR/Cas system CSM-associated protein Csm3 (group 7 of RAMP superfamily)